MKKVLFVITKGDEVGGASVHILDLIEYSNSIGLLPVVACGGRGRFAALVVGLGVELHVIEDLSNRLNPLRDIRAVLQLISIITAVKPSLVSLHSGKAGFLGRCACRLIDFPFVVMTVHGWSYTGWANSPVRLIYFAMEAVSAILFCKTSYIMVSSFDFKTAPPLLRRLSRAVVIHNGVQISNYSRTSAGTEYPSPLRLITVCRLDKQKDVPSLLHALTLVPFVQLTVVGGGEQISYCRELVRSLGIDSKVIFVDAVTPDEVKDFYQVSDCFVLCSKWEGFPRTTIEAMSYALPVIVSDVGGACEIFGYGKDVGMSLGKTNRPDRIAGIIRRYSMDRALASAHGQNAREIASQFFSTSLMCRRTIDYWLEKNPLLLSNIVRQSDH